LSLKCHASTKYICGQNVSNKYIYTNKICEKNGRFIKYKKNEQIGQYIYIYKSQVNIMSYVS
jgi:hypothetical protein